MSQVNFCRICLDNNVRMHQISGSEVQDVYEKLTNIKVQKDGGLYLACYICFCQLKNCQQLVIKSQKSNELLKQVLPLNNELDMKPIALSERLTHGLVNTLMVSKMESFQMPELSDDRINKGNVTSDAYEVMIKYEPVDETLVQNEEINRNVNDTSISKEKIKLTNIYATKTRHKCPHCEYTSIRKNDLNRHIRFHTGEKPYKCPQCSFTATTSSQLKVHVRTHTGEKPYQCDYCDCAFAQSISLKTHIRTHTGEKPFKCNYCDYKCAENGTLTTHIRIHTNERPFKCSYCDYTCKQNGNLKSHIRTHTGGKPFGCEICDKKFTVSSGLKRHIRFHHADKIIVT